MTAGMLLVRSHGSRRLAAGLGCAAVLCLSLAEARAAPLPPGPTQTPAPEDRAGERDALAPALAAAREAAYRPGRPDRGLRVRGEVEHLGSAGVFVLDLHPAGAFRLEVDGPLPLALASADGESWESDWNGLPRRLELAERERATLLAAVLTARWLDEDSELLVTADPERAHRLRIRLPEGSEHASVELDPKTHRVRSLAFRTGTWSFEEVGSEFGFPFPNRIRVVNGSGGEDVYHVTALEETVPPSLEALAAMPAAPDDHSFVPDLPATLEVRRTPSGHLLVPVRLDGRDAGWFIVDSGAGSLCIDSSVAERFGLETLGRVSAHGVGGAVASRLLRGGDLRVGPFLMETPVWVELDLAFLSPLLGTPIAGILGYDWFARAVVVLDPAAPRVAVHPQDAYALPAGGRWQRLLLDERLPCVEAAFEGDRVGIFRIDTGASGALSFQAAAVERWGLLDDRPTRTKVSGGVGGLVFETSGRLDWFELGGRRIGPVDGVVFGNERAPLKVSPGVAGTIGGGLLEPLTIVFDYPGRRIAFLPHAE